MRRLTTPLLVLATLATLATEARAERVTADAVDAAIQASQYVEAERLARRLVHQSPDDVQARYTAARVAHILGDLDAAHAHLAHALERAPDNMEVAGLQAMILLDQGRDDEARALIDHAMTIDASAGNLRQAIETLIASDQARAHATGQAPLPVGSPEAHVDAFVRALRTGAPDPATIAAFFAPGFTEGITSDGWARSMVRGLRGAAAGWTLIGWTVEPAVRAYGDDGWVRLRVVVTARREIDDIDQMVAGTQIGPLANMMDPQVRAMLEQTPPAQRQDIARRILGAPRRSVTDVLFLVDATGARPGIVDVQLNGASVRDAMLWVDEVELDGRDRDRRRGANLFLIGVIVAAIALTWVFWYTTHRRQQARRAARRRRMP